MFKTILFPVNQSQEARQAFDVVVEMVNKYQAKLFVMSVVEPETSAGDRASTADLLTEITEALSKMGIPSETKLGEGKPAFVICDIADEVAADLIVMGSRGMSLAEEHPDGSVSQKVINLSPCPVLVVP
ncbi:universal stress protein [Tumidithrix elongata RA019]|uniref:Universal stress protein n=1 Tax=Tumidithrix elongata BACA0141 TaxID=2716417 RepID=A0AAW9Q0A6_9CYAN|nr:universal stress protein [Tumidithrix elongata RA019]